MEPTNTHTEAQNLLTGLERAQKPFMELYSSINFALVTSDQAQHLREIYYRFNYLTGKEVANGTK